MKSFKIGGLDAHPTKGFRGFARPRKANSRQRRRLIPCGRCLVPLSHIAQVEDLRWSPVRAERRKTRAIYLKQGNFHGDVS